MGKRIRLRIKEQLLIKQGRDGREYTVTEMMDAMNMGQVSVINYKNGRVENPTMRQLQKWASFLGCRISDLYEELEPDDLGKAERPYPEELVPSRAIT